MDVEEYKAHIYKSFVNAEAGISKCIPEILKMEGMTGKRTRHLYNNLLDMPDARYLEVGTYTGSSLCSAIYKNSPQRVYVVDNWSEFGGPKEKFFTNLQKYKGSVCVDFFEMDFMKLDTNSMPKFNIYLYDGPHEYKDHVNALSHMLPCLDDLFIYIVDDWNWITIRDATIQAIRSLGLEIVFLIQMITTPDNSHPEGDLCSEYYWNGVCVFLLKKPSA